jgi:membrane glycosyltransferase
LIAITAAVVIHECVPAPIWWFIPLLAGPILAIPLVRLTSSTRAGEAALRCGLFVTPAERGLLPIVDRVRALEGRAEPARLGNDVG